MEVMVQKYTSDLPAARSAEDHSSRSQPDKHTVVLTGSTGSLGNYILQELIASPEVATVYCLNRGPDAEDRQRRSFEARGTSPDFTKVVFLQSDFAAHHLGLTEKVYHDLLGTATLFVHNAWAVDFNQTLESFEKTHIAGVRRCVDFSLASICNAHLVFISSIAGVANWSAKEAVPEQIFEDHSLPAQSGYGESKHVAELILAVAAEKSGLKCTVVRAGQLAGPTDARSTWSKQEWFPSLVITSRGLGVLPERLGSSGNVVDWVPMDVAAKTVWEVASAASARTAQGRAVEVAHLVNPQRTSWSQLVPGVAKVLRRKGGDDGCVDVVPWQEWLDRLRAVPQTKENLERNPALKLLGFYEGLGADQRGLPRLSTHRTAEQSKAMKGMGPITDELMRKWADSWFA